MRARCTDNKIGRQVLRYRDERYVDRVKSYRGTFAYEKALRKRRVWVEPLFGEAKDWHGFRQVQAQEVGEGEHRGAANRLRTEHKEVGSGSGAGSAEVGTSGGLASTRFGESLQASCECTVASFAGAKAYFNTLSTLAIHAARQTVSVRRLTITRGTFTMSLSRADLQNVVS